MLHMRHAFALSPEWLYLWLGAEGLSSGDMQLPSYQLPSYQVA